MDDTGDSHDGPLRRDQVYLAPLAGYTDLPFRRACRAFGLRFAYTPMVDAGALVYGNRRNATLLRRGAEEDWLGTQLLGSDPDLLARGVRVLSEMDVDAIDMNMGCPVKKVTQRGAGAALGYDLVRAKRCLEAVVSNSSRPVSAKIRVLHDEDPAPTVELARTLERLGIVHLAVHGRVWERVYSGPVATAVLAAVKEAVSIPVIANGGVVDLASAQELLAGSGADAVMAARGAIGNPWLFAELLGRPGYPPSHEALCEVLERHVVGMIDLYGESRALRHARKIILAYLKGRGYRRSLRAGVTSVATREQFAALMATVRREGPRNLV